MADQNMQRIEPEQDQGTGPEQEKGQGQETVKRRRGRPIGSGRGKGRGREAGGNHGGEGEGIGRGRGRGRRGGRGGGGIGKPDVAIRETEAGSNQWRAKCYQALKETDHVFLNQTAAAVSFDISHIIAIQRGFCKTGGRKGGCYLENASKQLLQDLMDVRSVKSSQRNGKDDLHSAVLVISRTLDEFLTEIRSKEDAEKAMFFYRQNPKDNHIIQLCFYKEKLSNPRHMRDVTGLEEIVEKHLEVLVLGLPDNPSAALHSVAAVHSDDEQIGGAAGNLQPLRPPPPLPEEAVVVRSKRKAAEDNTVGVSAPKKQRRRKDKDVAGDGGGGEAFGAEERFAPSLILEVFTECPNHGAIKSRHYHFAHDCVCEAKKQMQKCFDFINLDPTYRPYLTEDQLPPCFQEWKRSRLRMPSNI